MGARVEQVQSDLAGLDAAERAAARGLPVDVGAGRDQYVDSLGVAGLHRGHERGDATLCGGLDADAEFDEPFQHRGVKALDGKIERRCATFSSDSAIGAVVDEVTGLFEVTSLDG